MTIEIKFYVSMYLCYFLLEAYNNLPNHTKFDKDCFFKFGHTELVLIWLLIYDFFRNRKNDHKGYDKTYE